MTYFDERARDWDSDLAKVERARVVANAIRSKIPLKPGMTALEYGCGTGLLSFFLQMEFASILLADTSQGMLDVLSTKIETAGLHHLHPIQLDLTDQPLPSARVDIIYSLMTMHHIPETETVLRHFYTLLNPGGFLCIADLEQEDGSFHGAANQDVHKGFNRSIFQIQIEQAGFKDVHFSAGFNIIKIVGGHEKSFPVFVMTAMKKV